MTKSVSDFINEYNESGDYANLFEQLYVQTTANDSAPPWVKHQAHPHLTAWADKSKLSGTGKRAMVVGCGLGDDAEYLAKLGFNVTAFDVSATAITICERRFPQSDVAYVHADLFAMPQDWQQAFDFVFESRTIQALPSNISEKSIAAIASLVARDGTLLLLCHGRDPQESIAGIPWSLSRKELQAFSENHLEELEFDDVPEGNGRFFRVVYRRT
ncbi:MAG: class I SAM-dependent methyltransferase [Anaerolineae bacterium]|nr:class I SAM-dependent methyltransferase [Anaerolineae bacterium]MDQ7034254.1 class I SAM-dependent methyltransferase [Anaerolineae bacterium]